MDDARFKAGDRVQIIDGCWDGRRGTITEMRRSISGIVAYDVLLDQEYGIDRPMTTTIYESKLWQPWNRR